MMKRLLIADSNASMCDLYQSYLSKSGYELETASGGIECLEKLRVFCPQVLVLDMTLPWGGGDGVLGQMASEWNLRSISVVLTSTSEILAEELVSQTNHPVVCYLKKPFPLKDLLGKITILMHRTQEAL